MYSLLFIFITLSSSKLFVSLTFDDALIEHYDVSNILNSYGMLGTFYINSGRLNLNGRISTSQMLNMQTNGHEIAGHTIHHYNLTSLSDDDRLYEICQDHDILEKLTNTPIDSFAFPFGATFDNSSSVFESCDYLSARTSGGIETPVDCFGCPLALPLPPSEPYLLRSITYRLSNGLSYITSPIETALSAFDSDPNYYWIILIFHEVNDKSSSYTAIPKTDFFTFLSWIRQHPNIGIVKVNEVIRSIQYNDLYNLAITRTNSVPIPTITTSNLPTTSSKPTSKPTGSTLQSTIQPTLQPTLPPTLQPTLHPTENSSLGTGTIIGISVGALGFCSISFLIVYLLLKRRNRDEDLGPSKQNLSDCGIRISNDIDSSDVENYVIQLAEKPILRAIDKGIDKGIDNGDVIIHIPNDVNSLKNTLQQEAQNVTLESPQVGVVPQKVEQEIVEQEVGPQVLSHEVPQEVVEPEVVVQEVVVVPQEVVEQEIVPQEVVVVTQEVEIVPQECEIVPQGVVEQHVPQDENTLVNHDILSHNDDSEYYVAISDIEDIDI